MVPSVVAMTIAAPLVGRILHKVGSRLIVQVGLFCVLVGVLMYAVLDLTTTLFIVGGIIMGFGLAGLLGAPLRHIMLTEAAPEDRAAAQGLLTVFLAVGQLMGAAIVGGVAASRGGGEVGYQASFTVLAALTGTILLVAFLLKSRAAEQKQLTK